MELTFQYGNIDSEKNKMNKIFLDSDVVKMKK